MNTTSVELWDQATWNKVWDPAIVLSTSNWYRWDLNMGIEPAKDYREPEFAYQVILDFTASDRSAGYSNIFPLLS